MSNSHIEQSLKELYKNWSGNVAKEIRAMPAHGSDRTYYRIFDGKGNSAIGVHNRDYKENIAFLSFSKHFHKHGLNVPEIYAQELDKNIYLEQDLGDETLYSFLTTEREKNGFSEKIIGQYQKVVQALPRFQVEAGKDLDYNVCYPRHSFDRQSMMWDLNYFKYYFLKLAKIPFDEQRLEDDFITFTDFLLESPRDYFLYRDFQSRNVMIYNDEVWFIDYQGGRKGALQYDLASLLYDAKADIPAKVRRQLLDEYLKELSAHVDVDREKFLQFFQGFVLIRIMQALGAYGFRGFYERKSHFLKSVPYAIQNLEQLLHSLQLPVDIPALTDAWNGLVRSSYLRQLNNKQLRLTIRIQSFSYKRGIPWDEKGHGGGFVFDCRSLPNPGREEAYIDFTGMDKPVIEYLQKKPAVDFYLEHIYGLVDSTVENYRQRNFTDLMIAFGCTGGQHRSVYCAEQLAKHLQEKFDLDVELRHREQELSSKP